MLKSDGSVSTSISISPTSALIVLHPCDCRAVVRMLLECWLHKGNTRTAEYLLLPFSLSKLLLWRTVLNFRICKNCKIGANLSIASCGSRELAARDRASLCSAHAQSVSSDWWCVWAPDQLHFSVCLGAAGSFTVRSPRSRDIFAARRYKYVYKQSEESENGHQIMPGVWPTGKLLCVNEWYICVFAQVPNHRVVIFNTVCALMRLSYLLDMCELQTTLLRDVKHGFRIFSIVLKWFYW